LTGNEIAHMKRLLATILFLVLFLSFPSCYIEIKANNPTPVSIVTETGQSISPIDPGWKAPGVNSSAPVLPDIADVVEKSYRSVVTITTEQVVNDIFSRQITQSGAGSGWVLDRKGIIVTNNHVIENANKVVIQFADGRTFETNPANIFRDPTTDLAIIKVDVPNLEPLPVGDSSKLRVGDWVVAIGNPLGKGIKAKEGIISGLKVSLSVNEEEESLFDLIETSAAINPGNSGGPLLNMKGEVIGITSAKIASVGVEGMGYAISINSALPILQELINKGYVTRPFLGVELYTVNDYIAYNYGLSKNRGAIITYVQPGSPAARAGLKRFDIIVNFKGQEINTAPELLRILRNSQIGEEVNITYIRGKSTFTTTAKLATSPPPK
jgi:serine protease Do